MGTYGAPANITLFEFPKLVTFCASLVDLTEGDVHKVVTVDEMPVEGLAVLELNQLRARRSVHTKPLASMGRTACGQLYDGCLCRR